MKSTDLRIGNTIQRLFEGEFVSIEDCTIRTLYDIFQVDSGMTSHFQFEPIPLTEEWLLKFGFTQIKESPFKNVHMPYWCKEAVCLFYNESDSRSIYLFGYGFTDIVRQYYAATFQWGESVHELQNAYKVMTGKELTIKP